MQQTHTCKFCGHKFRGKGTKCTKCKKYQDESTVYEAMYNTVINIHANRIYDLDKAKGSVIQRIITTNDCVFIALDSNRRSLCKWLVFSIGESYCPNCDPPDLTMSAEISNRMLANFRLISHGEVDILDQKKPRK